MSKKNLAYYLGLEYDIIVHKEEMDGESWYTAFSKELGKYSCYAKGDTASEAVENFKEQKNDFITYLFEEGKEIPEPNNNIETASTYSGFFNVRTSPIIHAMLAEQASEMGISMNLYINQILAGAIEKKGFENQILNLFDKLNCKLDSQHYEITKQLKYQKEMTLEHVTWHSEYQEGYNTNYMKVA